MPIVKFCFIPEVDLFVWYHEGHLCFSARWPVTTKEQWNELVGSFLQQPTGILLWLIKLHIQGIHFANLTWCTKLIHKENIFLPSFTCLCIIIYSISAFPVQRGCGISILGGLIDSAFQTQPRLPRSSAGRWTCSEREILFDLQQSFMTWFFVIYSSVALNGGCMVSGV